MKYFWFLTLGILIGLASCEVPGTLEVTRKPPNAPSGLAITAGDGYAELVWTKTLGALKYNVYWKTLYSDGRLYEGQVLGLSTTYFKHTGIINEQTYSYWVTAVGTDGESNRSTLVTIIPKGVPNLLSTSAGDSEMVVRWSPVPGTEDYELEWTIGSATETTIWQIVVCRETKFVHSNVTNGQLYSYRVRSRTPSGPSSWSQVVSGTPVISAPTGLKVSCSSGGVALLWNPQSNATGYQVYRTKSASIVPTRSDLLSTVTENQFTDSGLENGTLYYYSLRALSNSQSSELTSVVAALPQQELVYNLTDSGYTVQKAPSSLSGAVWIPEVHDGLPVIGISSNAFAFNSSVVEVSIPDSVVRIGSEAFMDCDLLARVSIGSGVQHIDDRAFKNCTSLSTCAIPAAGFGESVFEGCTRLATVTLSTGIQSLGLRMFSKCTNLFSVDLPPKLNEIGAYAFQGSGLRTVVIPNTVSVLGDYVFASCTSLSSAVLPSELNTLKGTFQGCSSLTSVVLPVNLVNILDGAFYGTGFTSFVVPETVTNIGDTAFYMCRRLTSISLPGNLIAIGKYAFFYCDLLKYIEIPNTVISVGLAAFASCSALRQVVCNPPVPPTVDTTGYVGFQDNHLFNWSVNLAYVRVPTGSVQAYKIANGWSPFSQLIVGL